MPPYNCLELQIGDRNFYVKWTEPEILVKQSVVIELNVLYIPQQR